MKRIMLFGAGGQMGQALRAETLPADWELRGYARAEADILDRHAVQVAIQDFKPDLIINAAAMTNVDACEKDEDAAMAANFEAPANLAAKCSAIDIPMIHLSTDYVFDGKDGEVAYATDSPMNPLGSYGYSKMMGEEAVRHELAWHIVLRISSVFSSYGMNLLTKTIGMIEEREELKIVTDQKSAPTYAVDVAKALIVMVDTVLSGKHNVFGTFHLSGTPPVTRFEFVTDIMNVYAPYTTKRPKISPALSADFAGFAQRPAFSILDCSRTKEVFGIEQRPWREGLADAMGILMRDRRKVA